MSGGQSSTVRSPHGSQPYTAPLDPPPRRIAIFRALQLGDLLCTVPAWRALRAAYPDARITLIGLPWARDFAQRYRYLDDFVEFPGAPGLPERDPDAAAYPAFVQSLRQQRYDLLVQMHGSGVLTNPLVAAWGARATAGFHEARHPRIGPQLRLPWESGVPGAAPESEVQRYLRLAAALGAPAQGEHLEFPIRRTERRELARLLWGIDARYVCVHPGARYPSRRWPAARFAAVGDALAARGLRVLVTGTAAEVPLAREIGSAMRHEALDYTGRTTLGTLAALVAGARLVICNDTGISHVAAAVRTPSVVISSGADAERWRPPDAQRHRTLWHDVHCRPCGHVSCPFGHECALGVAVDAVMAQAEHLLAREAARAA